MTHAAAGVRREGPVFYAGECISGATGYFFTGDNRMRIFFTAAVLVACANSSAYAYLGGFEADDGYENVGFMPPGGFNVSYYNAGEYGANVDPLNSYQQGPNGAGLWERLRGPTIHALHGAYATSHGPGSNVMPHGGARALVVTTNTDDWTGNSQLYSYEIDQHDLDGFNPALTGTESVMMSFWVCSEIFGSATGNGLGPGTRGNIISFWDGPGASATSGLQLGYHQPGTTDDEVSFRFGNSGPWTDTGIVVDPHGWHRFDVTLDLATDRASVRYVDPVVPSNSTNLASSVPMPAMSALREIRFESTPGVNNDKYFALDDFDFEVCITEAPLSDLLDGGRLWSGDKLFSDFSYQGGGDMPDAEDVFVKAITDADGNFGIRFQGAFVDAFGGGASDALIDYKVTAPEGRLIKDVHMAANPLVIGGSDKGGLVSVTETFLPDNEETVLSVFDIKPGSRQLTDWADLVNENGDLAPVQELHVQKDILVWTQTLGSAATLSFIDQTFSQCDADPMNPGACLIDFPLPLVAPPDLPGDFNLDGTVDTADYLVWRKGVGTIYTAIDLEDWRANFGQTVDGGAASNAVPEPASLLLIALAAASVIAGRDRRGFRSQLEEN